MDFEADRISVLNGTRPNPFVKYRFQAYPEWYWIFLKAFLACGFPCAGSWVFRGDTFDKIVFVLT